MFTGVNSLNMDQSLWLGAITTF